MRGKDIVVIAISALAFLFLIHWEKTIRLLLASALPGGVPLSSLLQERAAFGLVFLGAGLPIFHMLTRRMQAGHPLLRRSAAVQMVLGLGAGGVLFGALLLYSEVSKAGPDRNSAALRGESWPHFLFLMVITGGCTPVIEELFYRHAMLGFFLRTGMSAAVALPVGAVFFAVVHPPDSMPVIFVVGLAFGILFWRVGLGGAILAHAVYNSAILVFTRLH